MDYQETTEVQCSLLVLHLVFSAEEELLESKEVVATAFPVSPANVLLSSAVVGKLTIIPFSSLYVFTTNCSPL